MNNVIDYYCYILATTKVKDLNLTVSCAWRWYIVYILNNDHRSHKHIHLIWSHVLRLVSLFLPSIGDPKELRMCTHKHSYILCMKLRRFQHLCNANKYQSFATPHACPKKTKYDFVTINRSNTFEKEHENILVAAAV